EVRTVQPKARVGLETSFADAEVNRVLIERFAGRFENGGSRVERRRGQVPKTRIFQNDVRLKSSGTSGTNVLHGGLDRLWLRQGRPANFESNCGFMRTARLVCHRCLAMNRGLVR